MRYFWSLVVAVVLIVVGSAAGTFLLLPKEASSAADTLTQVDVIEQGQALLEPVTQTNYLPIRNYAVADPQILARAAVLYDVESGRTLYSLNPDRQLPIASVTKLMTALVVLEHLDLDDVYVVSAEDLNIDGQGAEMRVGEQLSGMELLTYMLIRSSNDAAHVFERTAREEGKDLVVLMNARARQLGMFNTHFGDTAGLDDEHTYSTAQDLVRLLTEVSRRKELTQIMRTPSAEIYDTDGNVLYVANNTNQLLYSIPDIIGGKTGYTDGALGTMTLIVGVNDGTDEIMSVVLGSSDRFGETKKLINWAQAAHIWR